MKKISLLIITIITITACKKNDTTSQVNSTVQNPTNTTASYTLDAQGYPSGTYNGCLTYAADSLTNGTSLSMISCSFSNPALPLINIFNSGGNASVNSVTANGINISKTMNGNLALYNLDTTNAVVFPPCKWQINGNSSIPTFSYTSNTPLPSINAVVSQLPSTISRQQDFSVSINSASNYDAVFMEITNFSSTAQISVPYTNSTIVIPKDSLTKLNPGTNYRIAMAFIKYNVQTINGKNFIFCAERIFNKLNVVVN